MTWTLLQGDARAMLGTLPAESVHCAVTSVPYFGLRSYGTEPQTWNADPNCTHEWQAFSQRGQSGGTASAKVQIKGEDNFQIVPDSEYAVCGKCSAWRGELGSEPNVESYVAHLVEVFRAVWRVLHPSGTLWLNIGDSYSTGVKPKDLCMIPARVALALQADGWWLRSEIVWAKLNPMPESVTDRPTNATERIYLLSKRESYFYDQEAVREPHKSASIERTRHGWNGERHRDYPGADQTINMSRMCHPAGRNLRNWWPLVTEPNRLLHFASFPTEIPRRAILAGTSAYGACGQCTNARLCPCYVARVEPKQLEMRL